MVSPIYIVLLLLVALSACASVAAHSGAAPPIAHTGTHQLTYVALGTSDGIGVGTSDPAHDNWPTVLAVAITRR